MGCEVDRVVFWTQKGKNIPLTPGYKTLYLGSAASIICSLFAYCEMTIAQADNYVLAAEDQNFLAMGQMVIHG
jgi:hypothetical protein